MAISFVTDSGTLVIPGAYPQVTVQNNPSGLATTGVIVGVGEADSGPSYAEEGSNLSLNAFGPDDIGSVIAKYKSGPIVDAFRAATAASNDPNITGSFFRFIPVKTNTPTKASGTIPAIGGGTYATVQAKAGGKLGNLISRTVTQKTAESLPTTGASLVAPPQVSTDVAIRVNGGSAVSTTITAGTLPSAIVTAIDGLAGVAATGGTNRAVITAVAGTLTLTVDSGRQVHVVISTTWAAAPTVGDILYIPTGSPMATANEGTYVVTAATTTRIDCYKLLDAAGAGPTVTNPTAEGPIAVAATTDLQAFAPVVVTLEAGATIPGLGKSLEIANSGAAFIKDNAFTYVSATATPPAISATWVSTSAAPTVLTSVAERQANFNDGRALDAINEDVSGSGQVVLTLGYKGTTGSAVISAGVLTITVTGGAGTSPSAITLRDFATVGDLTAYLASLTGFSAAPDTAAQSSVSPLDLDEGTYGIGSTQGSKTGRVKSDGARFLRAVNAGSVLVNLVPVSPATKLVGQPDVSAIAFLTSGARGATTDAAVQAALDALQAVSANFICGLFSRDASADITDGLTDASSTYTIAAVNANLKAHVLQMSQLKRRKPRQAFCSFRGTFTAAKAQSGNLASARVACTFQDDRDVAATGSLQQFQPWHLAVKAAGMQAAGFYRAIVNKFVNVSGILQAAGDFDDQLDSNVEDALLGGLLVGKRSPRGGFKWVSDQTTYTRDDNFVFASIQAVYAADTVASTTAERMETMFVGQSVADISAQLALTALEGIMADMKRLKLIAASDDAPKGYRNAKIKISGPSMQVSLEIKLAGAIYFIPISFLVTPVQQSAG